MKKWRTYMPDQEIKTAALTIEEILYFHNDQRATSYRVICSCCKNVFEISHIAIRRRILDKRKGCEVCRNWKKGKQIMANWPVPPMLKHLPRPWSEE